VTVLCRSCSELLRTVFVLWGCTPCIIRIVLTWEGATPIYCRMCNVRVLCAFWRGEHYLLAIVDEPLFGLEESAMVTKEWTHFSHHNSEFRNTAEKLIEVNVAYLVQRDWAYRVVRNVIRELIFIHKSEPRMDLVWNIWVRSNYRTLPFAFPLPVLYLLSAVFSSTKCCLIQFGITKSNTHRLIRAFTIMHNTALKVWFNVTKNLINENETQRIRIGKNIQSTSEHMRRKLV
jgi:hypothetical protein